MAATPPTDQLDDSARLAALRRTGLLDSGPEDSYDRIGELARRLLGAPIALVTLLDADRQYFKCALGLPEPWQSRRETPLSHSICQHTLGVTEPLRIDDAARDPRLTGNLAPRELGALAYLGAPLRSRDGHVLGAFCVIDTVPRQWTDDDAELVQELAVFVAAEISLREAVGDREANARREALAVFVAAEISLREAVGDREANARREARRRQQAEALFDLAEGLSNAATVGEIVAAVAETGGGPVDADFVNIGLVRETDSGPQIELRHAASLAPEIGDRWPRVPVDESSPLGASLLRREPVLLPTAESIEGRFQIGAVDVAAADFRSLAAIPMRDGSAAIGFAWRTEQPLGSAALRMLTTVAGLVGQALERARLYDRERAIARELQASLLPPLTGLPGADIAARYEAGEEALDVGGDWFSVVELPHRGSFMLAVGDVVGHGVEAAGAMGQIRAAFEALAINAIDLGHLIDRLDRYAASHELLRYGTAVLVEYRPGHGTIELHSAGHVPALIRRGFGRVDVIDDADPPLGFDPDIDRDCRSHAVEPGDVVVLYTDGLVERRDSSIDTGIERLRAALGAVQPGDAASAAESLLRELGSVDDDAAVLVLRVT